MPTISEKIKRALAAIEEVRRALHAVDENHAEAEAVGRVLDGRRGELAEIEQQLARTKAAAVEADADHARWNEVTAKQRAETNAQIDLLQQKLQALEQQVAERRAESDNIRAGMESLARRLRAG